MPSRRSFNFGAVSYGMDYLDPSNLLGIWVSTGRHSWKNDEFDQLITDATPLVGDPAKRDQMFRDAEKILVDDVGGVFIDHRWQGNLYKPYVQGDGFRVAGCQRHCRLALGQRLAVGRYLHRRSTRLLRLF